MEKENIQVPVIEDKKKKIAKIFLQILFVIIIVCLVLSMYNLFYTDAYIENHFSAFGNLWKSIIFNGVGIVAIIIFIYLDFLPYFISRKFYKKGEYKKQIIWGIALFIFTQIVAASLITVFTGCFGCYERKYLNEYKIHLNEFPCVPNPAAGINCN